MIRASPPCREYSCAKTVGVRDIDKAHDVALRMIYFICFCLHWISFNLQAVLRALDTAIDAEKAAALRRAAGISHFEVIEFLLS